MTNTQPQDAVAVDLQPQSPQGKPCEACGCPVEPLDKFCPACGTPNPVFSKPAEPPAPPAQSGRPPVQRPLAAGEGQKHFQCQGCGAEVAADPGQLSFTCPFCDSNFVQEVTAALGRQPPEFVIGFAITPQQALESFQVWLRQNAWFRPGDLATKAITDKLKGVYLPFWSFSMLAQSRWSASIGEHWYRTETYTTTDDKGNTTTHTRQITETEWWPLTGNHHHYYSGFLVSGSKGLSQADAERIKPFNLPALKRFEPYFLAGWLAEQYSVEKEDALRRSQEEFYRWEQGNVAKLLPGDTHSQLSVETNFSQINSDLCLLPIYIASYRYQDKVWRFLMNGQTGKIAGDKPVSWQRILFAVGGVLLLIVVFLLLVAAMKSR